MERLSLAITCCLIRELRLFHMILDSVSALTREFFASSDSEQADTYFRNRLASKHRIPGYFNFFATRRILIIDPDKTSRNKLRRMLGKYQVRQILTVESGAEALLMLNEYCNNRCDIDITITELETQPVDAMTLITLIVNEGQVLKTRYIITSHQIDKETLLHIKNTAKGKLDGFLLKPDIRNFETVLFDSVNKLYQENHTGESVSTTGEELGTVDEEEIKEQEQEVLDILSELQARASLPEKEAFIDGISSIPSRRTVSRLKTLLKTNLGDGGVLIKRRIILNMGAIIRKQYALYEFSKMSMVRVKEEEKRQKEIRKNLADSVRQNKENLNDTANTINATLAEETDYGNDSVENITKIRDDLIKLCSSEPILIVKKRLINLLVPDNALTVEDKNKIVSVLLDIFQRQSEQIQEGILGVFFETLLSFNIKEKTTGKQISNSKENGFFILEKLVEGSIKSIYSDHQVTKIITKLEAMENNSNLLPDIIKKIKEILTSKNIQRLL